MVTKEFLEDLDCKELRQIDGKWYGLYRMIFTVGIFCDMDETGPCNGRICFDTWQNASLFLKEWDGKTAPIVGVDGCTADKRLHK